MKPIKMLGLAALAALLAMAFVSASSAMAASTTLCSNDPIPSDKGNTCEALTHVHETSVGKAKLLSEPTVECNVLFLGDTVAETSAPLHIKGKFTYSNCNNSCTVTEEGESLIAVLATAEELSSVTGEGLVKLTCFFGFIKCAYNGEGLEGHGLGPLKSSSENGNVVIEEQETKIESGTCPESAFLDITTTPLVATHVVAPLTYCVKTEHSSGIYTDAECKTKATTAHTGTHTLVYAWLGWGAVNDLRCYDTLSTAGLYETYGSTGAGCLNDAATRTKLYENGKITLVE